MALLEASRVVMPAPVAIRAASTLVTMPPVPMREPTPPRRTESASRRERTVSIGREPGSEGGPS